MARYLNGQLVDDLPGDAEQRAIDAAAAAAEVPASVTRFQAKAALAAAGLLADVEAAIAGADEVTRLAWAEAGTFEYASPTIATMAAALGMSDDAVRNLFRMAKDITA